MSQPPFAPPHGLPDAQIAAGTPGETERLGETIEIVDYDPEWPAMFEREAVNIHRALGGAMLELDHVGSTSVPGLAAKPILDIILAVADSADEAAYAAALEAAGYHLTIREPDWFEHRMFKGSDPTVNLHVFSAGCTEMDEMRLFRDWLRRTPKDVALYEGAKRGLARTRWAQVQNYADAKAPVIAAIKSRAHAWRGGGEPG